MNQIRQKNNYESYVRKVKIVFGILMVLIFMMFVVGVSKIHESPYSNLRYLYTKIEATFFRFSYAFSNTGEIMNGVREVFGLENFSYSVVDKNANSIPILVYHGILNDVPKNANLPTEDMTRDKFHEHMYALKKEGYTTITLEDLLKFKQGLITLPQKSVLITFDDGRADSFYGADPILSALDYNAVMFPISNHVLIAPPTGGYYISLEVLKEMANSEEWEVGAHAFRGHDPEFVINPAGETGNFYPNKLWLEDESRYETDEEYRARIRYDLEQAKDSLIENNVADSIIGFAFPFGDFGQRLAHTEGSSEEERSILLSEVSDVYPLLFFQDKPGEYFTQTYLLENETVKDSFLIRRLNMHNGISGKELIQTLKNGEAKPLPYIDSFHTDNGWIPAWSDYKLIAKRDKNVLQLKATPNQTGASVILDGTKSWEDYELRVNVESPTQTGVFIWARFRDDGNNAGCNFGKGFIHIEEVVDGTKRVIKGDRTIIEDIPAEPFTVGVRVNDRTISCTLNGEVVLETPFLDPSLRYHGGIGFKTWDKRLGKANIELSYLGVKEILNDEEEN